MNPALKVIYDKSPVFLQNAILSGYSSILDKQRYGGRFNDYRDFLNKSQWFKHEELINYQNEQLNKLLHHAYNTVPYYRNTFEQNKLRPADIKSYKDLSKLPILTKEDIKKNFNDLISTNFNISKVTKGHTSGTTGSPLEVCYDSDTIFITYAALDRMYDWAGCRLSKNGDKIVVARGNVIVPVKQKKPPFWRYNHYHNQLLVSAFHMSEENLGHYFRELESFKPKVIDGYPSTLYILAKYLKNNNLKFPVHTVISSSETLFDFQKELIEDRFSCKIFDYYALAERVLFSTECEKHEGHHMNMEYGIAEICDDNSNPVPIGESGRLIGTSLHNYAMPLIRYLTDDIAAIKNEICSCGRELDLMDDVTTKAEDTITLKDGRLISPSILTHPFKPMTSIEGSQIIQKEYDQIIIKIVPRSEYKDSDTDVLIKGLQERLGEDVKINIEFIDELPRTKNGKFRWVISEVNMGI